MNMPNSAYRLQFNSEFKFEDARLILDYLSKLGISHVYASPIFKARAGSAHGYDVVNPHTLNPELGSAVEFDRLMEAVKHLELGWIQDIVPNHMAIDSENAFLMDLLENGQFSPFYNYFDIDWNHPYESIRGKLLLPILGDVYGDCLERQEISLTYKREGFFLSYYDHHFPLRIETYASPLGHNLEELKFKLGVSHSGLTKLLGVLYTVRNINSTTVYEERVGQISFAKTMLWELYSGDSTVREFIDKNLHTFNGVPGSASSFELLDRLHSEQLFKLSYWKVATEELNYRRFFTVNDLISVKVEDENVFADSHAFIFHCVNQGLFTGLRVDHIDGLYNPAQYLHRLRSFAPDLFIIVEKILGFEEYIRDEWPIQGTTGYDFLNMASQVFCSMDHEQKLEKIYRRFTGMNKSVERLTLEKKRIIIARHMAGDIDNLALLIKQISRHDRWGTDMTLYGLRSALVELMAAFPVYRTYINSTQMSGEDAEILKKTFQKVMMRTPAFLREIEFIEKCLLLRCDSYAADETRSEWLNVLMRFQQFTGPLMAKGFEDTTLYNYNRMTSLNEVGGYPEIMGIEPALFHDFAARRRHRTPFTLNATSTHDTKRGEDTRSRISVLSQIPEEWEKALCEWGRINDVFKVKLNQEVLPDSNDEYFLYQTLLGAWPFSQKNSENGDVKSGDLSSDINTLYDSGEIKSFTERIRQYMLKAAREAKFHTGWIKPDVEYESALLGFIDAVLDTEKNREFFSSFLPFQQKIAWYGLFNSLSLVILKICFPGVPDFYQGSELWDLSLVDPDNRRKVDYEERSAMLTKILELGKNDYDEFLNNALTRFDNGQIKMFTIHTLLKHRLELKDFYQCASYEPLHIKGHFKDHIFAFRRKFKDQEVIIAVPRLLNSVCRYEKLPLGHDIWRDTAIEANECAGQFLNILNGREVSASQSIFFAGEIFRDYPGAVLVAASL